MLEWMGYTSLWQWVVINTLENLWWIIVLGPIAFAFWHISETLWGKRLIKRFRSFVRWFKRYRKPGIQSDYDLLKIERRKNKKLKERLQYVESLVRYKEVTNGI